MAANRRLAPIRWSKIETDLAILKWMVGFNLASTVAVVFMQLHH
jgi:hypothetical protein